MTTLTPPTAAPALSEPELIRLAELPGVEYAGGRVLEKPMSIGASQVEVAVGTLLQIEASRTGEATVFSQSLNYRCFADDPGKFRKPDMSVVRSERLA